MRARLIGFTAGAIVLAAVSAFLVTQAGAGANPVTVEIVVSCVEPDGSHRFDVTLTNNMDMQIFLDNPGSLVVDGNDADAAQISFSPDAVPAGTTSSAAVVLLPNPPSGTAVVTLEYTPSDETEPSTVSQTELFESCPRTPPTTSTTAPPPAVDDDVEPAPVQPTFVG